MSEIWTALLESQVYANVVSDFSTDVKAGYKNLKFTTEEEDLSDPNFPMVYIHLLPMVEVGGDLENTEVNGVNATIEVQVFTNTTKYDANIIANEVLRVLKTMAFSVSQFPFTRKEGTICRSILRVSRVIGSGDII